ncbi:MAG: Pyrrolo-quinoline quinone [Geminicoccaceae bacterium]|nr:Pyrrolo-quinoline quinone [Geminicoccaceae bacterium]
MQGRLDRRLVESLGAAAVLAAAGMMTAPVALADSSAARIKNCPDSDWCSYHRTVDTGWRYSPLAQINKDNIGDLSVAWIFQPGESIQGIHSTGSTSARPTATWSRSTTRAAR